VRLAVYDVTGRECAVLVDGALAAGRQRAIWDGRDTDGGQLPAGVYFARLAVGDHVVSQKLVLIP
jgi:flagellar hook assembly protein FlgD